jgi:NMD protein affecting ribosome stability and mRNA decay
MGSKNTDIVNQGRTDRLIRERNHDPYKAKGKLSEPTTCPECKAVFARGRWQWLAVAGANEELCPACRRIREKVPAGILTMSGEFFSEHRDEIMKILHNKVNAENTQHPLKRIMDLKHQPDGSVIVTFTDTHLPRGVGKAVERAYQGALDIQYTREAGIVRVSWER